MDVETQSPTVIAVAVAFAIITFVILSLRLYARIFLVKHVGKDDYLIIVASLLSWSFIAATIRSAELGLGGHYPDVMARGVPNFVAYLQTVWLSSVMYNATLGFIKTSVLSLYMRLGDERLRTLSIVMICVVSCQATAHVLVCIFQCNPVQAAYDITIPVTEKRCIDINAFYLANAAVNILTDILTYALPIPLVLKLPIPRAQRVGLGVVLCLGFVACLSSVIRITFIPAMLVSHDPTWDIAQPMYWSVIETNIGILASSIPSTKVIAKRYFPRRRRTGSDWHPAALALGRWTVPSRRTRATRGRARRRTHTTEAHATGWPSRSGASSRASRTWTSRPPARCSACSCWKSRRRCRRVRFSTTTPSSPPARVSRVAAKGGSCATSRR
ncbi:hypothetical protein MAPG_10292 [Magnaporthiopsis poae ATCC 64411]|uniref:Rhodopsin domain-containing protein n=1 Tax=Magnaporthiopsis poae (strain ATCC 64411 / 73-15) TaxID=644358 RepID=A0A0C4EC78_MAGP6|nr:hypothetical protein MAPG_10292 [Magnaporthiopsis poae ATCC 64411]